MIVNGRNVKMQANFGSTPDSAVLFTPQDLSPDQQAQARANIGAAPYAATDEKYFDIDFDGVVSLKPEYQNGGSQNAELPEIIVIPDVIGNTAVTALADYTFQKNNRVKSVTIPNSIIKIPYGFANEAFNLEELKGTDNVEVIGNGAFRKCGIKKALFPKLKSFEGTNNLNYAVNLTIVDIGNSVTEIPKTCFSGCERLSLVLGGAGVTTLGEKAFMATRNLKNLPLMSNVTTIGTDAFRVSRVDNEKVKPTDDWWSGCAYTSCMNPLGSTFNQKNPIWATTQIKGSNDTYGSGCLEVSAAHIYSALTGKPVDSPITFVEDIVGAVTPINGKAEYGFDDIKAWLEGVGEGLTCELLSWSRDTLGKVYTALSEGALALSFVDDFHAAVIYGVASNGEVLLLDSQPYSYHIGIYEAGTFQMPIWSFALKGYEVMIVRKGGTA